MKKLFYAYKRFMLVLVTIMAFAANANASSTWYAYYAKADASPSGNGKVYVSTDYNAKPKDSNYKDAVECKFVSSAGSLYGFAKPAKGYLFAGWTTVDPEEATTADIVSRQASGAYLELTSDITDDPEGTGESDSLTVAGMMPLEPNNQIYALFAKVTAKVDAGLDSLGTVSISNLCNVEGDEVTLTATPKKGATFVDWTVDGKSVSTDAKMKVTVGKESKEYVANFDSPNLVVLNFPEEGGYLSWYDESNDIYLDESRSFYSLNFVPDSVATDEEGSYTRPIMVSYYEPAQNASILYGVGDTKVVKCAADPEYIYTDEISMNRWSGENGVKCDTLDATRAYYRFDGTNMCLNLATEIPANECYIAMPDSCYKKAGLTSAPEVIYVQNAKPVGIEEIKAEVVTIPGFGRVYTIDGKEVVAPKQNGLYIKNGKKFIQK